jgi:hypothetical protein
VCQGGELAGRQQVAAAQRPGGQRTHGDGQAAAEQAVAAGVDRERRL